MATNSCIVGVGLVVPNKGMHFSSSDMWIIIVHRKHKQLRDRVTIQAQRESSVCAMSGVVYRLRLASTSSAKAASRWLKLGKSKIEEDVFPSCMLHCSWLPYVAAHHEKHGGRYP